jgi:hypothetical protein
MISTNYKRGNMYLRWNTSCIYPTTTTCFDPTSFFLRRCFCGLCFANHEVMHTLHETVKSMTVKVVIDEL